VSEIHSLVGYERRLHKMRRPELLAEAERVGAPVAAPQKDFILLSDIIAHILAAQGINDEIIKNPPR
jgi:hypothetical protein